MHPLFCHFLSVLRSDKSSVFSVETVMSDFIPQHFFVIGVVYQNAKNSSSSLSNLNNAAIKKSRPCWLIIKMHQAKHFLGGFFYGAYYCGKGKKWTGESFKCQLFFMKIHDVLLVLS